jgi:hypothetical protein
VMRCFGAPGLRLISQPSRGTRSTVAAFPRCYRLAGWPACSLLRVGAYSDIRVNSRQISNAAFCTGLMVRPPAGAQRITSSSNTGFRR